jgi:hypothetical protein
MQIAFLRFGQGAFGQPSRPNSFETQELLLTDEGLSKALSATDRNAAWRLFDQAQAGVKTIAARVTELNPERAAFRQALIALNDECATLALADWIHRCNEGDRKLSSKTGLMPVRSRHAIP